MLGSHHLQLPVRLTPGAGWLEDLTTHRATDDQMSCADFQSCVNGAARAIEYVERANLMSDGHARLHLNAGWVDSLLCQSTFFVMTLFSRYARCGHFIVPQGLCAVE